MQFASLGSGSKGNATLVRSAGALILIDCGFSLRETTRRMQGLGVEPAQLDAVLVTHEHSDHSSGVASLSRKHRVPVYLTHGTHATGRLDGGYDYCRFNCGDEFLIGDIKVSAVAVPHDAAEPCQYRLSCDERELGILTDLGSITPHVVQQYSGCHGLLLEFNHDWSMLQEGPYPYYLKQRVGGDFGHLNNEQAVAFLQQANINALQHLLVAHISEKNNRREFAEDALLQVFDSLDKVVFADQRTGTEWLSL